MSLALGGIAGAMSAMSGVVGAMGSIMGAMASSSAAKYNSEIAQRNADVAKQNATWAGQAGEQQAAMEEQKTRARVGGIITAQAANNIDVNSGSALDVRSSAASLGELSALTIRSNAAKESYGYLNQAWSSEAQSNLDQANASASEMAGMFGAAGDLISGIGDEQRWAAYSSRGGIPTS